MLHTTKNKIPPNWKAGEHWTGAKGLEGCADLPAGEGSGVRGSASVSLGSEILARLTRTRL